MIVLGTNLDLVKAPGNLSVSGDTTTLKLTAASVVVTGASLKMTVLASPTNTGNQPLCLNGNNLVSACLSNRPASENLSETQNAKIEAQQKQLQQQQVLIENLRKLVCASNPTADVCREVK